MFELDARLAADCKVLASLALCELLLMNDANYPWLILVPRREGLRELCELDAGEAAQLQQESNAVSAMLLEVFGAEKLNVAALGNLVPQLHVHHIARFANDAAWPKPVWGVVAPTPYDEPALARSCQRMRDYLERQTSLSISWR